MRPPPSSITWGSAMTDRELMEMALSALSRISAIDRCFSQRECIRRLEQRLAEPEEKPKKRGPRANLSPKTLSVNQIAMLRSVAARSSRPGFNLRNTYITSRSLLRNGLIEPAPDWRPTRCMYVITAKGRGMLDELDRVGA